MLMRTVARLAVLGGLLAGVTLLASPAVAAPEDGYPESNELILYRDPGRTNALHDAATDRPDYHGFYFINTADPVDNNVSSVVNNSRDRRVQAFVNAHFTGPSVSILRFGQAAGTVSWFYDPVPFNDALSSHRFIG